VEEGNDGTLKLGATASVDSVGREALPENRLANVGRDEERDTRAKTVALGEELVEEDDNERGGNKLENEEKADTSTERRRRPVETSKNVNSSLSKSDDEGKDCGSATSFRALHSRFWAEPKRARSSLRLKSTSMS